MISIVVQALRQRGLGLRLRRDRSRGAGPYTRPAWRCSRGSGSAPACRRRHGTRSPTRPGPWPPRSSCDRCHRIPAGHRGPGRPARRRRESSRNTGPGSRRRSDRESRNRRPTATRSRRPRPGADGRCRVVHLAKVPGPSRGLGTMTLIDCNARGAPGRCSLPRWARATRPARGTRWRHAIGCDRGQAGPGQGPGRLRPTAHRGGRGHRDLPGAGPAIRVDRGLLGGHRCLCLEWGRGKLALALGYGSLYNHSYRPNARYVDLAGRTKLFTAMRDIAAGEEITVNYNGEPEDDTPVGFEVVECPNASGSRVRRWASDRR